ncbi:MAG TPA: helix-turn-helix domain-containing protein [Anaeromyxobacter sp.]|nr:helix-turn-helix domain-containing protein [Anaeromyxobacter sp.]
MTCALVPSPLPPATPSPVELALATLAGKWKARLLLLLGERTFRFREVERRLAQVSRKVLVEQLRQLEASGLVQRTVYPEVPSRVEYSLTARGLRVLPVLRTLGELGESLLAEHAPEQATIGG